MKKVRFHIVWVFFICISIILAGCGKKEKTTKKTKKQTIVSKKIKGNIVKIGAILPLTGSAAVYGESCERGMSIAAGLYGFKIIFEDSAVNPLKAINAFNKLIDVNKVKIILGGMFSSTTLAFAPIAQREKILVLSPTAGSEKVFLTGDYIFSLYPPAKLEGEFMAQNIAKLTHRKNIVPAIVYAQEEVYKSIADGFKKGFESLFHRKVAFIQEIPPNAFHNYKDIILKAMNVVPKINSIYIAGSKDFVCNFIKQAKELNWDVDFYSQSTLYDKTLLKKYGNYLNGVIFTGPYFNINNKDKLTVEFVNLYKTKYKSLPDVWAAYGYDSVFLIRSALNRCSTYDNIDLIHVLKNINLKGLTGTIKFNSHGGAIRSFKIFKIFKNQFKLICN